MRQSLTHPWEPVWDARSRVLILGTFPSPKSRENGFYYGHPQNCFWEIVAEVLGQAAPAPDPSERKRFLLRNRIALWDVLRACDIDGASDGSIRNPVPNAFGPLLAPGGIRAVFTTGRKATALFRALCSDETGFSPIYLPSTSPANRGGRARAEFRTLWNRLSDYLPGDSPEVLF